MSDIDKFLSRKHLRKAVYLGQGLHPQHSMHWNLTVYFTADYKRGRAWVFGNFFCVEEVGLSFITNFFYVSKVVDVTEYNAVYDDVEKLRRRQNGKS